MELKLEYQDGQSPIDENEKEGIFIDTKYWIENKTYSPDEIAIRFKHRSNC